MGKMPSGVTGVEAQGAYDPKKILILPKGGKLSKTFAPNEINPGTATVSFFNLVC